MTEPGLRTGNVAAGAVVIGGLLVLALPQHAPTVVRLVVVAVAGAAGLHALAANVPATGWISPFRWMSPFGAPERRRRAGIGSPYDLIRQRLPGRRQPLENAPALPPGVLRVLRPLLAGALEVDPEDPDDRARVRPHLSELAWAVLSTEPLKSAGWLQTRGPDEEGVAMAVQEVLDELERLTAGGGALPHAPDSPPSGAPRP